MKSEEWLSKGSLQGKKGTSTGVLASANSYATTNKKNFSICLSLYDILYPSIHQDMPKYINTNLLSGELRLELVLNNLNTAVMQQNIKQINFNSTILRLNYASNPEIEMANIGQSLRFTSLGVKHVVDTVKTTTGRVDFTIPFRSPYTSVRSVYFMLRLPQVQAVSSCNSVLPPKYGVRLALKGMFIPQEYIEQDTVLYSEFLKTNNNAGTPSLYDYYVTKQTTPTVGVTVAAGNATVPYSTGLGNVEDYNRKNIVGFDLRKFLTQHKQDRINGESVVGHDFSLSAYIDPNGIADFQNKTFSADIFIVYEQVNTIEDGEWTVRV